eukprot:TRINITY_DN19973_c0_g1_i1.p1 TRINITY_DN19973_c0_g1~~TRINITY_DN19973_c0_g1_i1.p1  ORF type:complete len:377 (+),score=106.02 TRINITY_DN19973_c0_g1_i1:56-1186(+)
MADPEDDEAPPPEPVPPLPEEEYQPREDIFNAIFTGITSDAAKLASIKERTPVAPVEDEIEGDELQELRKQHAEAVRKARSLMYGEISMPILHMLLNEVRRQDMPLYPGKGFFVDLGSGVGKACVAASLLHPFEKVVGIESVQCLADMAAPAMEKFVETPFPEEVPKPEVQLIKGDFAAEFEGHLEPIADKIVVCLAVSTAFSTEQIGAMEKLATKMPDNSYFICVGQGLPDTVTFGGNRHPLQRQAAVVKKALKKRGTNPNETPIPEPEVLEPVGWNEFFREEVDLAWGTTTCFIYKKIYDPFAEGWAAGEGPWDQLVDLDKDEAAKRLKAARPDLEVELRPLGGDAPAEDAVETRVRIYFDVDTNLVAEGPRVG